jgi:hypothetical protein
MNAVVRNRFVRVINAQARSAQQAFERASPEHDASASSGAYFRAVRPTAAEEAALARGEAVIDIAKVERLRSIVEAQMWRTDAVLIAERMLDDAELGDEESVAPSAVDTTVPAAL